MDYWIDIQLHPYLFPQLQKPSIHENFPALYNLQIRSQSRWNLGLFLHSILWVNRHNGDFVASKKITNRHIQMLKDGNYPFLLLQLNHKHFDSIRTVDDLYKALIFQLSFVLYPCLRTLSFLHP